MQKLSARFDSTSSAARDLTGSSTTSRLPSPSYGNLVALPIAAHWNRLVPAYESRNHGGLLMRLAWDPSYAKAIELISERRAGNRIGSYIDMLEMQRVRKKLAAKDEASIRFGQKKEGHGYHGERGDFCLVGGVVRPRDLTVFYRSLEMIGGFAYDLVLYRWLEVNLKCHFKTVTVFACKAHVFALKDNSNEKLYPRLKEIFR